MNLLVGEFVAIRKFSEFYFAQNFCHIPIAKLKQICYNVDIS